MKELKKALLPALDTMQQKLLARAAVGNLRSLEIKRGLIDFYSNDYLGLSKDKTLASLVLEQTKEGENVNGSTGSRLLSGNSEQAVELETFLAEFFQGESALVFNSGYVANLSVLSSVPQKGDTIILDEYIHASLKEGARLSFANRYSFKHNDTEDLKRKLSKATGNIFVVVESVYSMDGDSADLKVIQGICDEHDAHLVVDEAHSTGIMGEYGEGLSIASKLENRVFTRIHTFGKAVGAHGACIVGSKVLIDYLINFARPFIYSTSLAPHSLTVILNALKRIKSETILRENLFKNISFFKKELVKNSLEERFIESSSPIHVCKINGNANAKRISQHLVSKGFEVRPILSPTVKAGEERLRICLHNYNTEKEISDLLQELKTAYSTI